MAIRTARDAAELLAPLFAGLAGEKIAVLHLDRERRVMAVEAHGISETDEIVLPMRDIFASALRLEAFAMVIAHNHPSGDATPSAADKNATRRLGEVAEALDIQLFDHLIFAGGGCASFRELGLL